MRELGTSVSPSVSATDTGQQVGAPRGSSTRVSDCQFFATDTGQNAGARRESNPVSLAASPSDPASLVYGPSKAMVLW